MEFLSPAGERFYSYKAYFIQVFWTAYAFKFYSSSVHLKIFKYLTSHIFMCLYDIFFTFNRIPKDVEVAKFDTCPGTSNLSQRTATGFLVPFNKKVGIKNLEKVVKK